MIDIRQSKNYADYMSSLGWIVERIKEVNYFIRKFPIIGSVIKVQRPTKIDFKKINRLIRKYRVFQTIIEPKTNADAKKLTVNGYKLSRSPYLPTKTLQIDLTQPQKTILSHFKKDARRAVKKAAFANIYGEPKGDSGFIKEYSTPIEIKKFREAWKKSVGFRRFVPPPEQLINLHKSFPDNNSVFLASHNSSTSSPQVLSGAIFLKTKDIGYYWQAFTNKEGRTSLSQYSLLYQGILWAKNQGCKVFDFEGIYDPRFPNTSWLGFTHFKKSFGGYEVAYPGCYTKFRLPLLNSR